VAELERERELLNAIANYAPSLICLVGADGAVRPAATNRAFERTLGYDPSETGGVLFWERYVPQEDAPEVRNVIEQVTAGGEAAEREGRWLTRNGELVHVLWKCTPLPMIESGPVFLVSAADISELKRQEEEVRTSRARLVAAGDDARRRLERNLHDGAQQRLMSLLLSLRLARSTAPEPALFDGPIGELIAALEELRELARGIHPEVLTRRGLAAALENVAMRAPVPVELDVHPARYEEAVEAAAYYVVTESLANVARYAQASAAWVRCVPDRDRLAVEVRDDGVGGADLSQGTGLRGLADRVASLDGTLVVESPAGGGTRVSARIPLG
jgi:PAS domain S-box-containing protein